MKKKKSWKTPAIQTANLFAEDTIHAVLESIAQGKHPGMKKPDVLYEALDEQLNKIENVKNAETQLKLLALLLGTDAVLKTLDDDDYDDFLELYTDTSAFFIELAKEFEDKKTVMDLIFDLIMNHSGEDGRSAVFLSLSEMFDEKQNLGFLQSLFQVFESGKTPENSHSILEAIRDVADGLNIPEEYARASFMQNPERSNHMLLDVANAYFTSGNLSETKRLLDEVKNPDPEDEREFLDLSAGYYYKTGNVARAIELAERLYERYPELFNLARLTQIVPAPRRKELLDNYENRMLPENDDAVLPYIDLLISVEDFERLSQILDRYAQTLTIFPAEILNEYSERLENCGKTELARKIRDWTVEEPEEVETDEE
ncbi:MAG: tetratricopeptide repeat protein [Fibrobacter sp.]|jgi:tetratricopeptide (TPR) repeat protein|nr:tetratricopeptide repeat protein [Fibrobacter sp.]